MKKLLAIFLFSIASLLGYCQFTSWHMSYPMASSVTAPVIVLNEAYAVDGWYCNIFTSATISSDGGKVITERGYVYSSHHDPTISDVKLADGTGTGTFSETISVPGSAFDPNVTLYFKAYATANSVTYYSNEIQVDRIPPILSATHAITGMGSVTLYGYVDKQGLSISNGFFGYGIGNPQQNYTDLTVIDGNGYYSINITGLETNTTYLYVSLVQNPCTGTVGPMSDVYQFYMPYSPSVNTLDWADVTASSFTINSEVYDDGGTTVTRGVVINKTGSPTLSNYTNIYTDATTGEGNYNSYFTGLDQNTVYYCKAFVRSIVDTVYGQQLLVQTLTSGCTTPTISTTNISNITATTATSGGNISSDGDCDIIARGVCWATSQTPTISDSHTNDGTGIGSFTSYITGLNAATTYYVRSYATNSAGTSYGSQVSFTTSCILPTVTTASIGSITQNSASGGGNVTSDGGCSPTARGVCYSTNSNPTISDSHTTDGTGTGSFTSSLTGLSNNTLYYVRAYATNTAGTAYGSQTSFTTLCGLPYVVANSIEVFSTSATVTNTVQTSGGCDVTARGVCYSTSQNPTLSDLHTTDGSGLGQYTSYITGLNPSTTYYERPYATNSTGTYYGSQTSFTTNPPAGLPTVSTDTPYSYYTVIGDLYVYNIMYGGNVTADGGASVSDRGVLLSVTNSNPTIGGAGVTKSQVGSGTGTYQSNNYTYDYNGNPALYTPGQVLYLRSYATNSNGTSYGSVQTFTTCSRPGSGLTEQFITDCIQINGGSISCFYNSQSAAEVACFTIQNPGGKTVTQGGTTCYVTSLSVGGTVYAAKNTTSCNKFNGYGYYYDTGTGTGKIIYVSGGVIQSVATCGCPSVGDTFQGGTVVYLFQSGDPKYYSGECHGIIASGDISTGIQWYNGSYVTTGATSFAYGYGDSNTNAIVSAQGSGSYAAKLCYDLTLGGFNDWFLPSSVELQAAWFYGGATSGATYWSSTEVDQNRAVYQQPPYSSAIYDSKSSVRYVKAIRYF